MGRRTWGTNHYRRGNDGPLDEQAISSSENPFDSFAIAARASETLYRVTVVSVIPSGTLDHASVFTAAARVGVRNNIQSSAKSTPRAGSLALRVCDSLCRKLDRTSLHPI